MAVKNKRAIMVALSSLAMMVPVKPAFSNFSINCTRNFNMGNAVRCSGGRVWVNPDGSVASKTGCGTLTSTILPGRCIIARTGAPLTKNVIMDFPTLTKNITRGADILKVSLLRMSYTGQPTPKASVVLTPAEISATVTMNIGGRINFVGGETLGIYQGQIVVRGTPVP